MAKNFHDSIPPTSGLGGIKGFLIGKPGIKHAIHQLGGDKGRTVVRIFPEMQNGQEVPWRLQEGDNWFSNWMCNEKAVAYAGLGDKFTCLVTVAGHEDDDNASGYQGPIEVFFRTMRKAIKDQPKQFYEAGVDDWLKWTEFKGPLPAIDIHSFAQGMLFENKGKPFLAPDGRTQKPAWPVLLMLKHSAMRSLSALCNKEVDNYNGNPEDFNARYVSGDPVGCANGKLIEFNLISGQQQSGGFGKWYEARIGQTLPLDPRIPGSCWKPWNELLRYLTEQEQMNLLVNHFPAEAIDFVFRGTIFYDYLGANVKGRWQQQLSKRTVPTGFNPGWPPNWPAQAPAPQMPYPPQPTLPPGYVPPVAPVQPPPGFPTSTAHPPPAPPITTTAAPIQMPPGIDLSGGFQQAGMVETEEEQSPQLSANPTMPAYPPPGAVMPPFDGGRSMTPPAAPIAPQAPMPAAPAPTQPTGDPSAASSAAAAARARLLEAQKRASAAQQPQK